MLVYTDSTEASELTLLLLRNHNIPFKQINITYMPKLVATLSAAGHNTFPVVVVGNDVWGGYRPDKIKALVRGRSA